jgi:hypothetical protein
MKAPIDFNQYKNLLKEYISTTTEFKDINYEGSGVNQLINILAYQMTHIGYYLEANDNEHYLQSAQTRTAVIAGAKRNGYVVRGKKASRAEVRVKRKLDYMPDGKYTRLDKDWAVRGINNITDEHREFFFKTDVFLYDYEKDGDNYVFFSKDKTFTLFQGDRRDWKFQVSTDPKQRFVIKDKELDVDTLRVFIKSSLDEKELGEEFLYSKSATGTYSKEGKVFYLATAEDGWYEIFFGEDTISQRPKAGQYIVCEYIAPSGEDGDGCTSFTLNGWELETVSSSYGGSDGESIESIKHNAMFTYRRQNRLLTAEDIKHILLEDFRNIRSINVWGGEDNVPKYYGKTIIAIKPNNSDTLSQGAKIDIKKNLINRYGYTGQDIMLVDPEYINVDIKFSIVTKKTISDITKANVADKTIEACREYSDKYLNQFGSYFNDLEMNSLIKKGILGVDSLYSEKRISKEIDVNTNNSAQHILSLTNEIQPETSSATFSDYNYTWVLTDRKESLTKGSIYVSRDDVKAGKVELRIGEVDYEKGEFRFKLPLTSKRDFPFSFEISALSKKPNIYGEMTNVVRIRTISVNDVLFQEENQ